MARFRAYTSESSSSDDEEERPTRPLPSKPSPPKKPVEEPIEEDESAEEGVSESEASTSESSSSEMDEDELRATARAEPAVRKSNALVQGEDGEIRYAHEVEARTRGPLDGDPTIIPWAQRLGVDAQKMHVMQTSLFRMPEEAAALRALHQDAGPKTSRKRLNLHSPPKASTRKHGRESDIDGLRSDSRERRSFAHHVEPPTYRPSRKYARVDKATSIANGHEGSFVDAGLALGRSFRVGWGPGGMLVHLGSVCSPSSSPSSANSSTLNLTNTSVLLASNSINNSSVTGPTTNSAITLSSKLLQHHLSNTNIISDNTGVPAASPEPLPSVSPGTIQPPSVTKYLDFASFATLFPSTDVSGPATLFRLGASLFDPIDLHLGGQRNSTSITTPPVITPDIRNRVILLRRKAALGQWLEEVSKPAIDLDLRTKANGLVSGGAYTPADAAFTHLTGHQIEKACTVAADGGYLKLSTLISQAGGDEMFKDDIREQLRVWKTDKLGPGAGTGFGSGLVGRGVWKVYSLLGGILDDDEEELADKDADVCSGLDWKRVFGLCLWYGQGLEASIADIVRSYEQLISRQSNSSSAIRSKPIAKPLPPWLLDVQRKKHPAALFSKWNNKSPNSEPDDPLYALIKLHADPALSLSSVLDPLSFSSSLLEAGIPMCWHLYIILSRVMRIRDFADRRPVGSRKTLMNGGGREGSSDDEEREGRYERLAVEGHSPTADLLSSAYAFELESWGMIQEAIFVLLHIEGSVGREKAIKDLLARSAPHLDEWMTRGIVGSLKIPMAWVEEAKAQYALSNGEFFNAYELFLAAGLYNTAHNIAVLELAPEAVLARDLDLVKEIFEVFDSETRHDKIEGWFVRGKVLLDYVHILTRLPKLQDQIEEDNEDGRPAVADAAVSQEIDDLTRRVPRIIGILPDVFYRSWTSDRRHAAATEEMVKNLLATTEKTKPIALTQIQQPTLTAVDGATKVGLVSSVGLARFIKSIEV